MNHLTKEEIQKIFDYTKRMNTPYKDVQVEIVDHIASGIESARVMDDNRTFERQLYDFTGQLSNDFFHQVESSKREGIENKWWRIFFQSIAKVIHPPMIFAWVTISLLFYFLMYQFGVEVESKIYIFLFWFEPVVIYYIWRSHKYEKYEKDFLFIKIFDDTIFKIYSFLYLLPLIVTHNLFDFFMPSSYAIIGYSAWYGFLSMILYIIFVAMPDRFSHEIETKYSHFNLKVS